MIADLRTRELDATELMDAPDCDLGALRRTYRAFGVVNRAVSGWRRCYAERIRPLLSADSTTTLLDVGSGGGDVARSLRAWAVRDGYRLEVLGIDPDPRAHAYATARPVVAGVTFRQAATADLVAAGERYDVVVSNHVLHHLDRTALRDVLADSERLADRLVLHNDLVRSRGAYLAWAAAAWPTAAGSFLLTDGLLSIRRSYTPDELAVLVPTGWRVQRQPPFRLLLTRTAGTDRG